MPDHREVIETLVAERDAALGEVADTSDAIGHMPDCAAEALRAALAATQDGG